MKNFALIAIMALTTYLVRMIPFVTLRQKVTNPFIKSLLFYMPYAILSAMTFPAIIYSTGDIISALTGTIVGLLLGFFERSLIEISLATSITALMAWFISA